jgi:hypothetical protein
VVLTADSILARSTRRRQTSTGWNTAYIGANRNTLPPDEKPPADDALHPMAFLVEKGPGAVTRPHFHQVDQFQVVVAGRGMLGDHEFSDGAVHYTDAYSAYGPIVAGKSGIWWFTLRNRWDPGARYMPAEREVLNAARDRHQHWELTTEAMPAALLGELCQATAISCRPVFEADDGLAGWRTTAYRLAPRLPGAHRAPAVVNSGWCWRAPPRSMAAIRCRPIPASSSARRMPPLLAPPALSAPNCCACNSAAARGIESRLLRPHPHRRKWGNQAGRILPWMHGKSRTSSLIA